MDSISSRPWTCVILVILVLVVCVCSASLGAVAWLQLAPSEATGVDRIAYVGTDGNIYTIDRRGEKRQALTEDAEIPTRAGGHLYRFPTWSPDNQRVAFVGTEARPEEPSMSTLYAATAAGGTREALFASQESAPFYLYWAPDSRRLTFLANETDSLSLRMASLDGEPQVLDAGNPFYFTWNPDADTLITHVGGALPDGRIGRIDIDAEMTETVSERPATFLAPAWSPTDDVVLYAAQLGGDGPALYLADESGEPQQALVQYEGAISFAWSPAGDRVAYIVTDQPRPSGLGQFAFGKVQIIGPTGGEGRVVSGYNALAFFWSPDSRKIAYLTPVAEEPQLQGRLTRANTRLQQQDVVRLQWRVVNLDSGEDQGVTTFMPAPGFFSLIPFFDQYAQSLSLWSPDSSALVYGARADDDSVEVRVVGAGGQTLPRRIANGDLPAWSWR